MDTNICDTEPELQPIEECLIKKEIDYDSSSPRSQDDEMDEEEGEDNPLYLDNVIESAVQENFTEEQQTPMEHLQTSAETGLSVWSSNNCLPLDTENDGQLIVPELLICKKEPRTSEEHELEFMAVETLDSAQGDPLSIEDFTPVIEKVCKPGIEEFVTPDIVKNGTPGIEEVGTPGIELVITPDLSTHMLNHELPCKCRFCDFRCAKRSGLKSHIEKLHTGRKLYRFNCDTCGRKFTSKEMYDCHIETHAKREQQKIASGTPSIELVTTPDIEEVGAPGRNEDSSTLGTNSIATANMNDTAGKRKSMNESASAKRKHIESSNINSELDASADSDPGSTGGPDPTVNSSSITLLKCTFCKFSCFNPSNFSSHMLDHELPCKCTYCDFRCTKRYDLKLHIEKIHTGRKIYCYNCDLCGRKYTAKKNLNYHMKKHKDKMEQQDSIHDPSSSAVDPDDPSSSSVDPDDPSSSAVDPDDPKSVDPNYDPQSTIDSNPQVTLLKCKFCKFSCFNPTNFSSHMLTHEQPFKCSYCDFRCATRSDLKAHTEIHLAKKGFQCEKCGVKFLERKKFDFHMKIHEKKCNDCGESFSSAQQLLDHARSHAGDSPVSCNVCGVEFPSQRLLRGHKKAEHPEEKRFHCEFCDYKCFESSRLTQHLRSHTGEKPHKCEYCEYACADSSYLKQHLKIHTGERPFQCAVCEASFARSNNLQSHMRTHTQEKPHKCSMCDYSSARSTNLKNHLLKKHGVE